MLENKSVNNVNDNDNVITSKKRLSENKVADGKETSIDNCNNDSNVKEKTKHTMVITPQIKLVEIKPQAAPFLFRLINENRYAMSEHIPYFQRLHGVNDVVNFIKSGVVKVVETDYIYYLLTEKDNQFMNTKSYENENAIEKNFLYFINYEKVPIGVIGIYNIDWYNRFAELHFWVTVRFQKKGFMRQVLPRMLDYLFYDVRLNRIIVKIRPNNNAGKMILRKYGFVLEGIERQSFYYIPEKEPKEGENSAIDKLKRKVANIKHHNHDEVTGLYFDLCVYSLIRRDYV